MTTRFAVSLLLLSALAIFALAPSAVADTSSAAWSVDSLAAPTNFSQADNAECMATLGSASPRCDRYIVTVTNVGERAAGDAPVAIADRLPGGVSVQRVDLFWTGAAGGVEENLNSKLGFCTTATVICSIPASYFEEVGQVRSNEYLEMVVYVTVNGAASLGVVSNEASVTGGEASEALAAQQNTIESEPAPFGFANLSTVIVGAEGTPEVQAGAHPYELTTRIDLNNDFNAQYGKPSDTTSVQDLKDVVVDLPIGLLGSALAVPECAVAQLSSTRGCPASSQVGEVRTEPSGNESVDGPIYNMVPEEGVAAEFGFHDSLHAAHLMYASVVPTPDGYTLQVSTREAPQIQLTDIVATFYGDPSVQDGTGGPPVALLTDPMDCSGEPLRTTVNLDSWQQQGQFWPGGTPDVAMPGWVSLATESPPVIGCNSLQFHASIEVAPTSSQSSSPSGLEVTLGVPQSTDPEVLATPPLRTAVVKLPEGFAINPSSAGGLQGCSLADVGMSASGEPDLAAPKCPEAAKIGTVEVKTPLLAGVLRGAVYVATPFENPFGSLVAVYIVINDPAMGIVLKLPCKVEVDKTSGRLTTVVAEAPQLPFSELTLRLKQGERSPLSTPTECGTYESASELTPWSAPQSGPPVSKVSSTTIDSGVGGEACTSPAFAPSFVAGTTNDAGGAFSPFTTILTRDDGEQPLSTLSMKLPVGVAGYISHVTLCSEPAAAMGDCPASSKIGYVVASAGVGSQPVVLPEAGKPEDPVYLTGSYKGGPFGISVVVPAEAGPFDLDENGRPVVVRGRIDVNPYTSQVAVESEPMPTILQGIPLDVRRVEVVIDRPEFMFNPSNCAPMRVSGVLGSSEGATEGVSSRFQAADCASLPFKPTFSAATHAVHTRKGGAYFSTKITSGVGQANLHRIHVTLPGKLPSRLDTLKQACTEAQFAANPAGCPEGAFVGTATVRTPVLPVPLTGPAIFVSHGGAGFPNLDFVLQGDGVTIIQEGDTFINKKQVTTSTFPAVPDVPVEAIELQLPEGPHSALAANGNLCERPLYMPTELAGQNGAVVAHRTKIKVTGCKPAIQVLRHRVKGTTATIVVRVPMAGKLIASGHGISRVVSKLGKAKTTRLKVSLSKADRRLLAKHPGHSVRVDVKLKFKPSKKRIKPISNHVTVLMR